MHKTPVVACIGAGQLARMMATAAGELGFTLRVLANSTEDSAAFALPSDQVIVGSPDDAETLSALLDGAQALTFEHELIPDEAFDAAVSAGIPARPSREALLFAKDKLAMRRRLGEAGLPMPRWADGRDDAGVQALGESCGWPLIAKVSHGGYDGRGVAKVDSWEEFLQWRGGLEEGRACLVEECVPFTRELAVMAGRRPSGEIRVWQPVQTWQEEGQCAAVLAPAPGLAPEVATQAREMARLISETLDVTGVFAVEMFLVEASAENGSAGGGLTNGGLTGNGLANDSLSSGVAAGEAGLNKGQPDSPALAGDGGIAAVSSVTRANLAMTANSGNKGQNSTSYGESTSMAEPRKARLLINELAMRPHNSGHWTQDGCVTSQFEQHLRATLDLPLGEATPTARFTAMANVLGSNLEDPTDAVATVMATCPEAKIHLYRKGNRPKRKLGHVNVSGEDPEAVLEKARAAADLLMGK
ncbi:MAG: ATP-grasp domain-containing protein [Mobiluncus porci]|uniref:5-(carboxyamino)imidazole ribonucleotide synthase n=1 Tax=Mobiluncus porci TaxID=2652278 RepID=UPI0023F235CA|nr:ATP-grasp domain-containing protein [Mobiluncus porci]MDD7541933.1 ATP-grasp domain-containing protein [Mobiluncus porci]MDY5748866.1 ATP-grasp domain-containing protein [Mobiluncus porci]